MKNRIFTTLFTAITLIFSGSIAGQEIDPAINTAADELEKQVIEWRRDFHQNPELSNREFETAKKIAAHLESLGMEVQTGVAKTGVVGILKGDNPGKVVALRADIDALPVTERNDLPFKSTVTTEFLGTETGVMHACGHDTHTAILMGVAQILSDNTDKINGT
jgi:amidohydrolase